MVRIAEQFEPQSYERPPAHSAAVALGRTALSLWDMQFDKSVGSFYGDEALTAQTPQGDVRIISGSDASKEPYGTGPDIESALFDSWVAMRRLETIQTESLAEIRMSPVSSVSFTEFSHYSPKMAPSMHRYPVPFNLSGLLEDDVTFRSGGLNGSTYRNTIEQKGWQMELRQLVEEYCEDDPAGQQLRGGLGIRSFSHLTPEQAVKLSAAFVQDVSRYSYADRNAKTPIRADSLTAAELLEEGMARKCDHEWAGNLVCRNVACNVKAVFEGLKDTQADLSMLRNTYCVFSGGRGGVGYVPRRLDVTARREPRGHAWNEFVTVGKNGSAVATIIDATWALGKDTESAVEHLDYTDIRSISRLGTLLRYSDAMPETFEDMSAHIARKLQDIEANPRFNEAQREEMNGYVTTEYLKAVRVLLHDASEPLPEDYRVPNEVIRGIDALRYRLHKSEITAAFALDTAGGGLGRDFMNRLIVGYDRGISSRVGDKNIAPALLFMNDALQALVFEALGKRRVAALAKGSKEFRVRERLLRSRK